MEYEDEICKLEEKLAEERAVTADLLDLRDQGQQELDEINGKLTKTSDELERINKENAKQRTEMAAARQAANDEVRRLSVEVAEQRHQIDELYEETRQYEAQMQFLSLEREMLLLARKQASELELTSEMQMTSVVQAHAQKQQLESALLDLNEQWEQANEQTQQELREGLAKLDSDDKKERSEVLEQELAVKTEQLAATSAEKDKLTQLKQQIDGYLGQETTKLSQINSSLQSY